MRAPAPLGRFVGLALICAGLGTASLATPEVATAAVADRPTAIAIAPDGTSYVGFSTGGKLVRVGPNGRLKGGVPLDQDEAVDGLFATNAGDVWVDYETSFSLLGPEGRVRAHFDHQPSRTCDSSRPASRYGGITANGDRIYIANRCHDSMSVYARNGDLVASVGLPGRPRGIAYGNAQAGRPAFVYVAIPDQGKVLAFRAASLRSSSRPTKTYTLRRPAGGARPEPAGVAVDKWGQLTVSDMANNALYLLDTNNNFSLYRTLGHPPHASRAAGRLNHPSAIAQHAQDGGALSGNLFIADTDNGRVQRWDTGGYTFWAKGVRPGAGGGGGGNGGGGGGGGGDDGSDAPPENEELPQISGTPAVGEVLECDPGTWTNGPTTYGYSWSRDGTAISGAIRQTYPVVAADDGATLTCTVRARNSQGSDVATSAPVIIGGGGSGGSGPTNDVKPSITGTAAVGQVLTCNPGTWSVASPTFEYQWNRAGAEISDATARFYTVVSADSGTALTCTVTATASGGHGVATSGPVTVTVIDNNPPTGPVPTLVGAGDVGTALTCDPGTWTGTGISYTFAWQSDGVAIPDTAADRYVVLSQDVGHRLTCSVTARNAAGKKTLISAVRMVGGPSGHAPVPAVGPTIVGTASTGQTLTCDVGTWTGDPTITYTMVWQRDGVTVAPGPTYLLTSADRDAALRCVVVAGNGSGKGAARSDAVGGSACTGPVGVTVNGGAAATFSPDVQLSIRPPAGATKVFVSNDAGMAGAVERPLSGTCSYAWRMDSIAGLPLTRSVYISFDAGPATTYSDSILVDEPAGPLRLW